MKNFKKVLSFALALLMVVGCLTVAPINAKADETTYTKVTSVSEITAGGKFVLVATKGDASYAVSTSIKGKPDAVAVTVTNGELSGENIPVWTIEATTNGVGLSNGTNYLAYNSSTNFTTADDTSSDKAEFSVTLADDGLFRFTNVNATTRAIAYQYESNGTAYSRFGAYATSNDPFTKGEDTGYIFGLSVYKADGANDDEEDDSDLSTTDLDVPAGATQEEIVDLAYTLGVGFKLTSEVELTGKITSVDTPYSEDYGNITVTIQVGNKSDKLIKCYRLTGTGAADLAVNDEITVKGTIINYNGTVEFNSGCTIVTDGEIPTYTTPEEIVNAAYALEKGAVLPGGPYTLTGIITSVDTAYDSGYQNVTVTMVVGDMTDKPIQCFRLKGTGADAIGVGDEITVTGSLKNYNGTIEFDAGCTLDSYKDNPDPTPADIEVPADATDEEIVALAQTLVPGQSLKGTQTLTGIITEVNDAYSEEYKNITITIQVGATEESQILVYRVKGEGADVIKVGDTVTVSGTITNYKGTIEFTSGCTIDSYTLAGIDQKGDVAMPVAMILFAGAALVAVAFVGKRKMA